MRKVLILAVTLLCLLAALYGALRRLPPAGLGWSPSQGRLVVAGSSGAWVPRWRFRAAGVGPVDVALAAASAEGAGVEVRVRLALPGGSYALAPGETVADGVRARFTDEVRGVVAAVSLDCLANSQGEGCGAEVKRRVEAALAARLGVGGEVVTALLLPDPAAVAAGRRAAVAAAVQKVARRVVVVGLDGADWELLEPLARRGVMPNLARLMAAGSYGQLESLTPLLSPLIWTTMATGVSPDEHGVLDFLEVDPGSGARQPISGRKRRVSALWNIASAAGLSPVVAGWWATWPAEAVNGVVISDRLFYLLADSVGEEPPGTLVYPPQLEGEFKELVARAARETDEAAVRALMPVSSQAYREATAAAKGLADPIDGFRRILVGTRAYFGAALATLRPTTDLLMVYCIGTDEVGHLLGPYVPPLLPGRDAVFGEVARLAVERYHAVVDRWIGRLLENCPLSECAFLVVSDHGFKWGADRPRELSGVAAATAAVWHRPLGVFVAAGSGIERRGKVDETPSVYDVAPTVTALLGLPAGEGWRGRSLPGCPPAAVRPVDWNALLPPDSYRPSSVASVRPSAEVIAQLKALGYLEGREGGAAVGEETEGSLNNLGLVHLEAKRYAEAETAFRKAIAVNPRYASPHYNLRRLYLETSRLDEADASLWRAVELGLRDAAGAVDRAARDYEALGLPDRALDVLRRGVALFRGEVRLVVHYLAALVRRGRCSEGLEEGRKAAQAFPSSAAVHAFYGLAAGCANASQEARTALQRSLELDPNQPMVAEALASLSR